MDRSIAHAVEDMRRREAERREADEKARSPLAERIFANNLPAPNLGGMTGMLQAFSSAFTAAYHKRAAASWIIYLRKNRLALRALGANPYSADESILARIAHHRREAMRLSKIERGDCSMSDIAAQFKAVAEAVSKIKPVYCNLIARAIKVALDVPGAQIDQHQANGLWCVHQLRVRLPNDPQLYRVIVAPAEAPIFIGKTPADEHFSEPIHG